MLMTDNSWLLVNAGKFIYELMYCLYVSLSKLTPLNKGLYRRLFERELQRLFCFSFIDSADSQTETCTTYSKVSLYRTECSPFFLKPPK